VGYRSDSDSDDEVAAADRLWIGYKDKTPGSAVPGNRKKADPLAHGAWDDFILVRETEFFSYAQVGKQRDLWDKHRPKDPCATLVWQQYDQRKYNAALIARVRQQDALRIHAQSAEDRQDASPPSLPDSPALPATPDIPTTSESSTQWGGVAAVGAALVCGALATVMRSRGSDAGSAGSPGGAMAAAVPALLVMAAPVLVAHLVGALKDRGWL
jgi:hypothetical protein